MNSFPHPTLARRAATGGLLCLGMLALSSCAGFMASGSEEESTYAKASDMVEGTIELQNWIPRTATEVSIKFSTTAEARPITSFTLNEEDQLPGSCLEVTDPPPAPQLDAEWMPEDAADIATLLCGDFAIITEGRTVTAWDTRAPELGPQSARTP